MNGSIEVFPARVTAADMEETLNQIAEQLDIPEGMFKKVEERYGSLSRWLERDGSVVAAFKPALYVQGSFALGTMVRPLGDGDEFDIDCVCDLDRSPLSVTQKTVKTDVGTEVKSYVAANSFKRQAQEWDKCWTIEYADDGYTFKIDVVPAVPDAAGRQRLLFEAKVQTSLSSTAILITDKCDPKYAVVSPDWPGGNPKGYAEWFKERMKIRLLEMKRVLANRMVKMAAEDIPDFQVKTPLQKAVQLLKRHRDIYFDGKEHRPSSIVLTTLAARAYENEATLVDAMSSIVNGMEPWVDNREGVYWVENPIDPTENFADAWSQDPAAPKAFYDWLAQLKRDWEEFFEGTDDRRMELLEHRLGSSMTKRAFQSVLTNRKKVAPAAGAVLSRTARFDVPHRILNLEKMNWTMQPQYHASISGRYSHGGWVPFSSDGPPMEKELSLRFFAETNAPKPYEVFWQVVNTGKEAEHLRNLRGEIFKAGSYGAGGLHSTSVKAMQDERTLYTGTHWVECFIVHKGVCMARSEPFVVNIK